MLLSNDSKFTWFYASHCSTSSFNSRKPSLLLAFPLNILLLSSSFIAFTNIYYLLILFTSVSSAKANCQFPPSWAGEWFQRGIPERIKILVDRNGVGQVTSKGVCTRSNSDKFLFEDTQESEKCIRCVAMHQKHINVLQYKESACISIREKYEFNRLCDEINGDAPLYSLFRLDAKPIACPFLGYFKFTYNRGRGECRDPASTIDSCTDANHLLFNFQACTDIQGSESKVETLECYAEWKTGSLHYLVGKNLNPLAKTEDDRFRCFVFEQKNETTYDVAQSADATCDGLEQTSEGPTSMTLIKTDKFDKLCNFPQWASLGGHWQTLNRSHIYDFSRNSSFKVHHSGGAGEVVREAHCIQDEPHIDAFVVHSTAGCDIGYICMKIVKRSENIIEILISDLAKTVGDACLNMHRYSQLDYVVLTLITTVSRPLNCPLEGIYGIAGEESGTTMLLKGGPMHICSKRSTIAFQCDAPSYMRLKSTCTGGELTKNFQCIGGWKDNRTSYIIISSVEDDVDLCISHTESDSSAIKMTISATSCHSKATHINHQHHREFYNHRRPDQQRGLNSRQRRRHYFRDSLAFNLTERGLCHATGQALGKSHTTSHFTLNLSIGLLLVLLISFKTLQY